MPAGSWWERRVGSRNTGIQGEREAQRCLSATGITAWPSFCMPHLPCSSSFFVGVQLLPGISLSASASPVPPSLPPQPSTSSTPLPSWLLFSRLRQSEPVDTGVSQLSSFLFKTLVLKLLWSQMWEHTRHPLDIPNCTACALSGLC